jgi:hypothetical protein
MRRARVAVPALNGRGIVVDAEPVRAADAVPGAEKLGIAAILLVGAALRMWGLRSFPLDQDELYTVMEGRDLFHVALAPGIHARPLYFLLQHVMLSLFPATEGWLRLVPFVAGVAGIWAVWVLARRVFGGAAGLVAAVLVAVAPWHLHESGFARYWSVLFLLSALFQRALWEAYGRERMRGFVAALVPLALGSATHPSFAFPAAGAALGVTLVRADGRFGWRWPSRLAWMGLWMPYLALIAAGWAALRLGGHSGALQNWGGRGWLSTLRLVPAVAEWLSPAMCVAGLLGAAAALASGDAGRRRWGAMAACGVAATLSGMMIAAFRTDVYADYATAMLPLVFVSAGGLVQMGVERMASGRALAAWAATAVLCAAVLPATVSHISSGTRYDYRPAFAYLRAHAAGARVLTWPRVVADRYAAGLNVREMRHDPAFLERELAAAGDVWVVSSVQRYGMVDDDEGLVSRWLAHRCTEEAAFERPRWDYRIYRVVVHHCVRTPGAPPRP